MPARDFTNIPHSRSLGFYSVEYVLRFLRNVGPLFDFDYERMIIAFSVALSNVQALMASDAIADFPSLDSIIPAELQAPVTRSAIARSCGLPRETVRRKVKAMIGSGVLISDTRGGLRLTPGIFATEAFSRVVELNEADVRRLLRLLKNVASGG